MLSYRNCAPISYSKGLFRLYTALLEMPNYRQRFEAGTAGRNPTATYFPSLHYSVRMLPNASRRVSEDNRNLQDT
jgi:hypothetical protein